MRDVAKILLIGCIAVGGILVDREWIRYNTSKSPTAACQSAPKINAYDPNDQALRYMSKPPAEWTKDHGDSERSLILYNLSATAVVAKEAMRSVGVVSQCVNKAHPSFVVTIDGNQIMDPNNYTNCEVKE